jgi:CheY-like chemotaxis protein
MDITLPGANGVELTQSLKANPETQAIPIILSSAIANPREKAFQAGADMYIAKPFDIDVFERTVQRFLKD